ncbi:assembly of actin patch protein [Saitoella coloradoensis]
MAPSPPFSVRALYAYTSDHDDDLTFDAGEVIMVTSIEDEEWYFGKVGGREGMFPMNFVGEVEEEAQEEVEEEEVAEPVREEVHEPEPEVEDEEEEEEVIAAPIKPAEPKPADIAAREELIRATSPPPSVSEPAPVAAATKPAPPPAITTNLPSTPKSNPPSASSDKPSPSAGGGSSFRDRIAAFNKSADAPMAPKPMQKPSSFVKKPFVPPPPSAAAYTSSPAVPKPEQAKKHEVVHPPPPPPPVMEREAAPDASSSLSRTSSMESKEEDAPKVGSLRDRIAALQQSRLNPMGGPPPPKPKPAAKPTPRQSGDSERRGSGSMEEMPRRMSSESRKSTVGTPGKERPSFTGEREESGISEEPEEVDEEVVVPGTAAPVERVESHTSHPDVEAPAHDAPKVEEESEEEDNVPENQQAEEEVDPEVARRIALRERMAKMSGGMGMMGMALGMPPPPAVKPKPKHALEHVERHEEDDDDRSMAPVPILPGMGPPPTKIVAPPVVQHEAEVEREEEEEEDEDEDDEEGERISELPADQVTDMEDLNPVKPPVGPVHEEEDKVEDLGLPPVPVAAAVAVVPLTAPVPPVRAPAPPAPVAAPPVPRREPEHEVTAPAPPIRAAAPPAPIPVPPVPTRITEDSADGFTSPPPTSPTTAASKRRSYVGGSGMRPAIPMSPPATKTSAPMSPPPPPPANSPPRPTQHEEQYKSADRADGAGLGITGPTESAENYIIEDPELISAAKHASMLSKALDLGEPLSTSPVSPTFPRQPSMEAPRGVPPPPPGAVRAVPPPPPVAAPMVLPPPVPVEDEEEYNEVEEEEEEEEEELIPPPQAVQQGAVRAPPPPPPSGLPQRDVPPPPPPSMMIDAPHNRAAPPPPLSPPPVRDMPALPPVMAPPGAAPRESLLSMPAGDYRTSTEVSYTPSIELNRANTQSRRSLDYGGGPNAHIARDVDLGRISMWWTQPNTPPPVFQNRPNDLIYEIDESTQTRRGGHSIVTKDVYVLFQDYSQTVVSAQFEAQNPSQVELSQTHKPPPPQLSQMALEDAWARFGARVQEAAAGFAGKVVGAGDPFTFVRDVVAKIPDALKSPGTRSWGALVYANLANASVIQHDEIRAGDIITFRNSKFQGHKGGLHTKYAMEVGKPEHVAVVFEWDGTKKKVRAWEQGREGKKVEKVSYKLGDLKSGEVRIWRVVGKGYVGWE